MLGSRNFRTAASGGDNGIARAKKMADLLIRKSTGPGGKVTDPAVYDQAIALLDPFSNDLSVQQKQASYANNQSALIQSKFNLDNTVAAFRQDVTDSLFSSGDKIRDPAQMAFLSAANLDNVVRGINNAIASFKANDKDAGALETYRKDVMNLASAQRDLVNNFHNGTANPNLDGYGYFVKTNPSDGSLVGAALMPIASAPAELTNGMKKVSSTVKLGNSSMPVYLPATQGADGTWTAQLGANTWKTDTNNPGGVLSSTEGNTPDFSDDTSFDLSDTTKFPIKQLSIAPGGFGRAVTGGTRDNPVYTTFYRGKDGKPYQVDDQTLASFQNDPVVGPQLKGYIPLLNPDDVQGLGSVAPINLKDVKQPILQANFDQAQAEGQVAQKNLDQANANPFLGAAEAVGNVASKAAGFVSKFFATKNRPNKPDAAPQGDKLNYSPADVVDSGKSAFRAPPSQ